MPRISSIKRNEDGRVVGAELDDGRIFSMEQVFEEAKKGNIEGVCVDTDRHGREYLRAKTEEEIPTLQ